MKRLFEDEEKIETKRQKQYSLEVGKGKEYKSINEALEKALGNEVVHVYEGVYKENIVVQKDGVKILAIEGEKVVLEASNKLFSFLII